MCEKSGDCFQAVVQDLIDGIFKGSEIKKGEQKKNSVLETANFEASIVGLDKTLQTVWQ